jgi:hypothetical protein
LVSLRNAGESSGVDVKIVYGEHARGKILILRSHSLVVADEQVRETLPNQEKIEEGYRSRKVAQRRPTERHVLRVVYEEGADEVGVVTFYPGRRSRYAG